MVPLQAWFAGLSENLADPQALNDQHHAFSAWRGEQGLRLVPGLRKPFRWRVVDDPLPFAAIGGLPLDAARRRDAGSGCEVLRALRVACVRTASIVRA